jgi:hypothetical protein
MDRGMEIDLTWQFAKHKSPISASREPDSNVIEPIVAWENDDFPSLSTELGRCNDGVEQLAKLDSQTSVNRDPSSNDKLPIFALEKHD